MRNLIRLIIPLFILACVSACKKGKLEWQKVEKIESHTADRLNEIIFTSGNEGYIVGGDRFNRATILKTTDGGNTWDLHNYPEAGKGIYGITKASNGNIYAVGYDGKTLTNSGGSSWQFSQLAIWKELKDLDFFDNNNGIIVAGVSFKYGYIAYVDEQLHVKRWDSLKYELNDIIVTNSNTAFLCGYGVVQKTTDAGQTWNILEPINDNFTAMHMLSEQDIWMCGIAGTIYRTKDGGNSWEKLRNGNSITLPKYKMLDIYFIDNNNGWAVGEDGLVVRTTDGGKKWSKYKDFTKSALRSITTAPDGTLMVVGDNGTIYKLYTQ